MQVARRARGIGLALVLALVFCVWRARGDETTAASPKPGVARRTARVASVPMAPKARPPMPSTAWFAQRGERARVAGIVTTEDGAPVQGARIHLANAVVHAQLLAAPTALTDASGRFDLGRVPTMHYLISAEAPAMTPALTWIDTSSSGADAVHLVLQPCVASIHGTIADAAGGVVPNARVMLSDEMPTSAGVETDERGAYELCVPPGPTSIEIGADGYAQIRTQVNVFGPTRRDFELVPGATVVGRVVRAADNQPVAGALVELTSSDSDAELHARSDDEGRFEIDGVVPGTHVLTASAEGLTTDRAVDVVAEIGAPGREVVCPLVGAFKVAGTIVEEGGGKPIEGVGVVLTPHNPERLPLVGMARSDGTFVVERVVPGAYSVEVTKGDVLEEREVTVVAADVNGVVVELARGARITGRVLHGGKPVAGALVKIDGEPDAGHSDASGRYTIPYLPPGDYELYAESLREGAFTRTTSFTLIAGEAKTLDLELDLEGSIAGVVVDERGAPVPDVFVKCALVDGDDMGMATTAADGSFLAGGLSGGGEYVCVVRHHDGSALVFGPASGDASFAPIAVADGKTRVTGVRLSIRNERFKIAGRVLGEDGTPLADVRVTASGLEEVAQPPIATTDARGAFTLRDLPAGTYSLYARSPRGEAWENDVAVGAVDVVIHMIATEEPMAGVDE